MVFLFLPLTIHDRPASFLGRGMVGGYRSFWFFPVISPKLWGLAEVFHKKWIGGVNKDLPELIEKKNPRHETTLTEWIVLGLESPPSPGPNRPHEVTPFSRQDMTGRLGWGPWQMYRGDSRRLMPRQMMWFLTYFWQIEYTGKSFFHPFLLVNRLFVKYDWDYDFNKIVEVLYLCPKLLKFYLRIIKKMFYVYILERAYVYILVCCSGMYIYRVSATKMQL